MDRVNLPPLSMKFQTAATGPTKSSEKAVHCAAQSITSPAPIAVPSPRGMARNANHSNA